MTPQRKVFDVGFFDKPEELRKFLSASRDNRVIITDWIAFEMFKGEAPKFVRKRLQVIADRPEQFVLLKETTKIAMLRPRSTDLLARFTDRHGTRSFREYCQRTCNGGANRDEFEQFLAMKQKASNEFFEHITRHMEGMRETLGKRIETYPSEALLALKNSRRVDESFSKRLQQDVIKDTHGLFRFTFGMSSPPSGDLAYSFPFRYVLCMTALIVHWGIHSGYQNVAGEKLRNDFIDAGHAAYATLFDGLVCRDTKLKTVYTSAMWMLNNLFRAIPGQTAAMVQSAGRE
jgi:hypothetical protein